MHILPQLPVRQINCSAHESNLATLELREIHVARHSTHEVQLGRNIILLEPEDKLCA